MNFEEVFGCSGCACRRACAGLGFGREEFGGRDAVVVHDQGLTNSPGFSWTSRDT